MDNHIHPQRSSANPLNRNGRHNPNALHLPSNGSNGMSHSEPPHSQLIDPRLQQQQQHQQQNHTHPDFSHSNVSPLSSQHPVVPSSSAEQFGPLTFGGPSHPMRFHGLIPHPGNPHPASSYPTPPHSHMPSVPSSPGYAAADLLPQKGLRRMSTHNGIQHPEAPLPMEAPGAVMTGSRMILPSGGMAGFPPQPDPGGGLGIGDSGSPGYNGDGRRRSSLATLPPPSGRPPAGRGSGAVIASGDDNVPPFVPHKNAEGKYKCPNCPKTYLHAKHLKRHFLRHTGERPYQCALCRDTFSRSDILKRHFQKCQVRRGNPEGVSHLTRAHAHQQKPKEEEIKLSPTAVIGDGSEPSSPEGKKSLGKACDYCMKQKIRCDLGQPCQKCRGKGTQCNYSRNQRRQDSRDGVDDLLQSPGFQHDLSSASLSQQIGYGDGFNFPPVTHPNAHLAGQSQMMPEHRRSQSSASSQTLLDPLNSSYYPQTQTDVEWGEYIHPNNTGFVDTIYGGQNGALVDGGMNGGLNGASFLPGLYTPAGTSYRLEENIPGWPPLASYQTDPLQAKCNRLVDFCFTDRQLASPLQRQRENSPQDRAELKQWLTPDNIKHFYELFLANFQGHFPMIHAPTLNVSLIDEGLLMAIVCTGAVYSPRGITVEQVRHLIDLTYAAVDDKDRTISGSSPSRPPELEEVQAILLCHILMTWHGNATQREVARKKYSRVLDMARRANIFRPITQTDDVVYSVLHQPPASSPETRTWNWNAWIEQEKRVRTLYTIYLLDTAFVLYFNAPPQIAAEEIRLPLPADDAAWDASNAQDCCVALGLNGDPSRVNKNGTRCSRQPMFLAAVKALLDDDMEFECGITNAFSKFILIHAIHVHIWIMQSVIPDHEVEIEKSPRYEEYFKFQNSISKALNKWKYAWDTDIEAQYPPGTLPKGFCRDAKPYWFLATMFSSRSRKTWGMVKVNDDSNVQRLTQMLRYVHTHMAKSDLTQWRPTGAVGQIAQEYGVDELTYNMKMLFKPIDEPDDQSEQEAQQVMGRP